MARGAVIERNTGWRGATKENPPRGSSTEEQRSRTAFGSITLRAAGLLAWGFVVACVTARCGDAPHATPRPNPESPAAAPLAIFRQALRPGKGNAGARRESRAWRIEKFQCVTERTVENRPKHCREFTPGAAPTNRTPERRHSVPPATNSITCYGLKCA